MPGNQGAVKAAGQLPSYASGTLISKRQGSIEPKTRFVKSHFPSITVSLRIETHSTNAMSSDNQFEVLRREASAPHAQTTEAESKIQTAPAPEKVCCCGT